MASSTSGSFQIGFREHLERYGVAPFWRWWMGELKTLLPAAPLAALKRRRARPTLVFEPSVAILLQPDVKDGALIYVESRRIPLTGDAAVVAQAGRAALDALPRRTGGGAREVTIVLSPSQVLVKRLVYPAAAEENVTQVIGYDLDRHTPFKPDELYYDAAVVERNPARREIVVMLAAALRSVVDGFRRQAAGWGATVTAITPERVRAGEVVREPRLNLVPASERRDHAVWRNWTLWAPALLVAVLALAALAVPLWQKREQAIELARTAEVARTQAAAANALRTQLEQATGDYNFVLERKYQFPSTLQLLDEISRMLPDDTWITQLEFKAGPRGKDAHRELLLRGESANAGRLVSLLEESKLFEQAAPRSPTTKIQPGPGEIFDLGAQLQPSPMPAPVQLVAGRQGAGSDRGSARTPPGSSQAGAPPTLAAPAATAPPNPTVPNRPAAGPTASQNAAPALPATASPPSARSANAATPAAPRAGRPGTTPAGSAAATATPGAASRSSATSQFGPLPDATDQTWTPTPPGMPLPDESGEGQNTEEEN